MESENQNEEDIYFAPTQKITTQQQKIVDDSQIILSKSKNPLENIHDLPYFFNYNKTEASKTVLKFPPRYFLVRPSKVGYTVVFYENGPQEPKEKRIRLEKDPSTEQWKLGEAVFSSVKDLICLLVDLQVIDIPITNQSYALQQNNIQKNSAIYQRVELSNVHSSGSLPVTIEYMLLLNARAPAAAYKLIKKSKFECVFLKENQTGNTPLHLAIQCGHFDLCEHLKKKGADSHHQNKLGRTPLELAAFQSKKIRNLFGVESEKQSPFDLKRLWNSLSSKISKSIFGDNLRNIIARQESQSTTPDLVSFCISILSSEKNLKQSRQWLTENNLPEISDLKTAIDQSVPFNSEFFLSKPGFKIWHLLRVFFRELKTSLFPYFEPFHSLIGQKDQSIFSREVYMIIAYLPADHYHSIYQLFKFLHVVNSSFVEEADTPKEDYTLSGVLATYIGPSLFPPETAVSATQEIIKMTTRVIENWKTIEILFK